MKRTVLFVFASLLSTVCLSQGDLSWKYPLNPSVPEWEQLGTYTEKLNAYNIPSELLKRMPTQNLIEACLSYPELRLIMTRNSLQDGYDYIKSIFNGFDELEKRKDSGDNLLRVYEALDPSQISSMNDLVEKGRFTFEFTYIELILSQKTILSTVTEKDRLGDLFLNKFDEKAGLEEFGEFGKVTPALGLGRLMEVEKNENILSQKSSNARLSAFIDAASDQSPQSVNEVISLARIRYSR